MFLELIENVSHDKPLMAYTLTSLEAIISGIYIHLNPKKIKNNSNNS